MPSLRWGGGAVIVGEVIGTGNRVLLVRRIRVGRVVVGIGVLVDEVAPSTSVLRIGVSATRSRRRTRPARGLWGVKVRACLWAGFEGVVAFAGGFCIIAAPPPAVVGGEILRHIGQAPLDVIVIDDFGLALVVDLCRV